MFTSNFLGSAGLDGRSWAVAHQESRGPDGFGEDSNSFGDEWKQLPREQRNIRRILRLGDQNNPKQHAANSNSKLAGALNGARTSSSTQQKCTSTSTQHDHASFIRYGT